MNGFRRGGVTHTHQSERVLFLVFTLKICLVALPFRRRGAGVVERARLESECAFGYRGFESLPLRHRLNIPFLFHWPGNAEMDFEINEGILHM